MENALLLLHLFLVIFLIALVLLQRSEGGALGMGGGGGGLVTGRGATTALQKATWYLAAGFLATSLALTVIAQSNRQGGSVLDNVSVEDVAPEDGGESQDGGSVLDALTPPTIGDDAGVSPSAQEPDSPAATDDVVPPPADSGDDGPAPPPE